MEIVSNFHIWLVFFNHGAFSSKIISSPTILESIYHYEVVFAKTVIHSMVLSDSGRVMAFKKLDDLALGPAPCQIWGLRMDGHFLKYKKP